MLRFRRARPGFEAKIQRYAPRYLAFLGKRALSAMLGQPRIAWGRQTIRIGTVAVWVLPNPSGLNRGFNLDALVGSYSELRTAIREDTIK
jgi:TDG/mug DNA glycosylase family protein